MQNTREIDILIEITQEHIESNEAREDRRQFDERNEVSVVVTPMATQPIIVEKTHEIEEQDKNKSKCQNQLMWKMF
jgi:hypothetical protein